MASSRTALTAKLTIRAGAVTSEEAAPDVSSRAPAWVGGSEAGGSGAVPARCGKRDAASAARENRGEGKPGGNRGEDEDGGEGKTAGRAAAGVAAGAGAARRRSVGVAISTIWTKPLCVH